MIYTLTLNPAIDLLIELTRFQIGATNKVTKQVKLLGGKGINAAIMIANLHQEVTALGFMTNSQSLEFQSYLISQKVRSNFTHINGSVRTNLKIHSKDEGKETEINCLGFVISEKDETELLQQLNHIMKVNDILLICGSIASGCNPDIYQKIAELCQKNKIIFAVDATNDYLLSTLKYHPLLIKPNLAELNQIFTTNYDFTDLTKISALGQKLRQKGAQNVLISNGETGSLLVTERANYFVNSATGTLVSSVGAGDSMFAAFIVQYLETKSFETALKYAAAAGSSTAFTLGIAGIKQIEKNLRQIRIRKI